ncbi:MAG: hypothetical protein IPQ07_37660 [Myxococcales bacterium]|nr:hypothetical protein [Myxococcales bacterium]
MSPKQAEITKVAVTSARCQAAIKTWLSLARSEARSQLPEVDAARSFLGSRTAFVQCTVDDLATLLGPSVAMLDDHRLIVDHSPSDGPRIEVRRGAIGILRDLTQRSFGPLAKLRQWLRESWRHVTTLDEDRATVQAWSSWWKTTSAAPTVAIAQGQRTVADALARERSAAEARLRTSARCG